MFCFKKIFSTFIFGLSLSSTLTPMQPQQFFRFKWDKNWCWMASALECFYVLKDFRVALNDILAQDELKLNQGQKEAYLFFKKLNTALNAKDTQDYLFHDLYDSIYLKKVPPAFLKEVVEKWKVEKIPEDEANQKLFQLYLQEYDAFEKETNRLNQIENYKGPWPQDPPFKKKLYLERKYDQYDKALDDIAHIHGKFSSPLRFIVYLSAALKQFESLPSVDGLMRWTTTDRSEYLNIEGEPQTLQDFINKKKDCKILIIHIAPLADAPAERIQRNQDMYNLVGVCVGTGNHFTALVKYEKQWREFDSMRSDIKSHGENYHQALAATGKIPNDFFYVKADTLVSKLLKLKAQLELLKLKLSSLSESLNKLRARLGA